MLTLLAGCSGGNSTPRAQTNRAPVFTSSATVTEPENSNRTIYTAAASDADGDVLTYAISGGADAARFSLTSTGALSFSSPPDFEMPTDADRNNIYLVSISVSDGLAMAVLDITVTVTNGPDVLRLRRVATGFRQPLFLTAIPDNSGRVLVVEKTGLIRILNPATGTITPTPFLDVSSTISTDGEQGLLGLALAPDFASSRRFFVYLNNLSGDIEVRRFTTFAADLDRADPATSDTILTIGHPGASNHNGGWIDFGADGNLYLAVGDGGGGGDPNGNAQNPNSLLGKMLRIDPRSDQFPGDANRDYAIPAGNPFATAGGAPEIWMLGLRNPFRNSFDRTTGNLYIADVGQAVLEEINLVPAGASGLNFGWNRREGTQPFNGGSNSATFTPPVAEYAHGSGPTQGNSITGGYVYRGPITTLNGQYFFGDFVSKNIWTIPSASFQQGQTLASSTFVNRKTELTPSVGTLDLIASFGTDQLNNLYIVDFDGEIYLIDAT
ncbi:PQQ-dependent sugar dehydrogenase [Sphingomonas sp. 28-62-11]|uniref:PQQ-dependent sugar dehydrogenase n=1 Tax=Sphingomonas sp. 28-62-11 TaxID=1970432 RepID=UPI0035A8C3E1